MADRSRSGGSGLNIVVFGLTVSSSWGNGHATLWRGLIRALSRRGHAVTFFERDEPYYALHRDLWGLGEGGRLLLYPSWPEVLAEARRELEDADVALVTSYCPDGVAATEEVLSSGASLKAFYDLDTPVTLSRLEAGEEVAYLGPRGLAEFDLVLSYTGGGALGALRRTLGARRVAPLYGHVDPSAHRPVPPLPEYRSDLSYIGTYAADRQATLEALFVEPARRLADRRFVIAGSQYPDRFPWTDNISFFRHLPPAEHPAFFSSSRLTLNVTRGAMAEMGFCPSGRLFEAAACGAPILTDRWEGLERFFEPGREVVTASTTEEALAALELSARELSEMARAARERVLSEHTADHRAAELERTVEEALAGDEAPREELVPAGPPRAEPPRPHLR